jgi:osmotically-inducible protein OsmY
LSPTMQRICGVALAAVLVLGSVACATGPLKSEAERTADKETVNRVQLALNSDQQLFARHITVRADGGVVSLGGYVWSQPDLEAAQRIAADVSGVTRVVNEMELERGGVDNSPVSR